MLANLFEEHEEEATLNSRMTISSAARYLPVSPALATGVGTSVAEPPAGRPRCGLCGLENQGATCYLNSLLQTLLYTPEFRDGIFQVGEEELCKKGYKIPLQLQHLFATLLLADQQAASTTELTNSFGWNNHEELQQHDVQELNRILFSAIDESLIGTSGSNLISKLYHGSFVNQICCQECSHISAREEDFLDINVIVSGFKDLQSSLNASYLQTEVMKGSNQYYCPRCNHLVDAKKGMKIRKLPPILTFSLLRFSFDSAKGERFKESGKLSFPMTLDMSPYCEKISEETDALYDLFSVVIHSGSSNRGHYHVYIRDIDDLGTWDPPENKGGGDCGMKNGVVASLESPLSIIMSILCQRKEKYLTLDALCSEIAKLTGISWNKQFKKLYGPINKFLLKHNDMFAFNHTTNTVHLLQYKAGGESPPPSPAIINGSSSPPPLVRSSENNCEIIASNNNKNANHNLVKNNINSCKQIQDSYVKPGSNWFDFNDTRVTPIRWKDVESQFGGKESAYMLFYRKKSMLRPASAQRNPAFNVPSKLCDVIEQENQRLKQMRKDHEVKMNTVNVHIHFGATHHFENGSLRPIADVLTYIDIEMDRRKTVAELRDKIVDMASELCPNNNIVLSFARELPAGLHLYDEIRPDQYIESLQAAGIAEGTQIFVWDGKQVGGESVQVGPQHEPVLLTIVCILPHHDAPHEISRGFSKSLTLAEMKAIVCSLVSVDFDECSVSKVQVDECESSNIPLDSNKDSMTLGELGFSDGDTLYIENRLFKMSTDVSASPSRRARSAERKIKVVVQNRCGVYGELSAFECPQKELEVVPDKLVEDLICEAVAKLELDSQSAHKLRRVSEGQTKKPPYHADVSLKQAGIEDGACISIEEGVAPMSKQVTLLYSIGAAAGDQADYEITVDKSLLVSECLKQMLALARIEGDSWHLRKTNWCGEPSKALQSDITLDKADVQHGDLLLILEGRQPPRGYFSLPVFLAPTPDIYVEMDYTLKRHNNLVESVTAFLNSTCSSSLCNGISDNRNHVRLGEVEVSSESTLSDLKKQILTLPPLASLPIPSITHLRLRTMNCGRLGKVLKGLANSLKKLKLANLMPIYVQVLPIEEDLSTNDILLSVCKREAEFRCYSAPTEVVWNAGKSAYSGCLKKFLSDRLNIPWDSLALAKHLPESCEWMVIDFPNGNRRKKQDSKTKLRNAPYFLKDGDTIGIKDVSLDPSTDFSSLDDEEGRRILATLREEKKSESNCWALNCGARILGGEDMNAGHKFESQQRNRTPEVGILIRVNASIAAT